MEILQRLKSTEPPEWLAPNPSLSQATRIASKHLFASLKPACPKSPFDQLLIEGFDNEQIYQQIDILAQPLLSTLQREVKWFEKHRDEILISVGKVPEGDKKDLEREEKLLAGEGSEDLDDEMEDMDMEGFDEDEEDDEVEEGADTESDEGNGDEGIEKGGKGGGIEDGFFSKKELKEFLEKDEAREYGLEDTGKNKKKGPKAKAEESDESEDEFDDEEDGKEEDDDDDELEALEMADGDDEDVDKDARYEDFYGSKSRKDGSLGDKKNENLSTHERERLKLKATIEQMEKANLEQKTWTMQGEVTAAKRPKNSALGVDLDFEHNARPPPVVTEEVTASLEEMIRKRILDGHFDDVEKPPSLPTKAPRELKELDENKSQKGLAEVYEEEYAQKTNLASAPLSFSDEQKKEAGMLFKKLCLKLDALSHFHFAPKPVIEDMSVQANVPALAMEEIAPLAVSDAAMLAPEEVFAGEGDIEDETELTQAERKRRRADKKRKYKAKESKRVAKKATKNTMQNHTEGKED